MPRSPLLQPDEIKDKALRLYPKFLSSWLSGSEFFPLHIRGIGVPDNSLAIAQQQVQKLKSGSKEVIGFGYVIQWQERNSRHHGRNLFPERVMFESRDDFLRFIAKHREFADFELAVNHIRRRMPSLESWLQRNRAMLMQHADVVDDLLDVVAYFREHPRPGVFAREIPLSVDTKFIEQNVGILTQWLDIVMPPGAIRSDEQHFARRFGLRYEEPQLLLRFLDPEVQRLTGSPWSECGVPLHSLANSPIPASVVIIVENKINLLTFPSMPSAIAIGGLGNAIVDLTQIAWLADRILWYWGDLDVEGFEILSRLRIRFPHTRSFLMDAASLERWSETLAVRGTNRQPDMPPLLTDSEAAAFHVCLANNIRIEQERIPQSAVIEAVSGL